MPWTPLWFGKHKGRTIPQILFKDPDWFFWAVEKNIFRDKGTLKKEAAKVKKRACAIKIPGSNKRDLVAEYGIHPSSKNFGDFEIVPRSRPPHVGSTKTFRRDVIDMSIPRKLDAYDKLGYRLFIKSMKFYLFKDDSTRMTRQRSEDFFDDNDKFVL
jgi:hypothetical protein